MIARQLVVVEVVQRGAMLMSNVDHCHSWVVQFSLAWVAALDRDGCLGEQYTAGEKVVFMGTARMGNDGRDHLWRIGFAAIYSGLRVSCEGSTAAFSIRASL